MSRFVKLDSDFEVADLEGMAARGRTPMVSLEPWSWRSRSGQVDQPAYSLVSILRGDHDAAFRRIGRVLGEYDGRVLLRFAHEMNADWYPWGAVVNGNSPRLYVAAWRHVHALIDAEAPRTRWVWAPVATWWENPLSLKSVYPGDDYVDYVAASGYGHGGTPQDTYGSWYSQVRAVTRKPALLSEIGADGADKAAWIAALPAFLADHPDIRGFVWFNTSPQTTGATGDYRIDDTDAHLTAFRDALKEMDVACA